MLTVGYSFIWKYTVYENAKEDQVQAVCIYVSSMFALLRVSHGSAL